MLSSHAERARTWFLGGWVIALTPERQQARPPSVVESTGRAHTCGARRRVVARRARPIGALLPERRVSVVAGAGFIDGEALVLRSIGAAVRPRPMRKALLAWAFVVALAG